MTANKARLALTLSLALALAACGGGGGGGGGDDDDGGPTPPPPTLGSFDGSYTLRAPNGGGEAFDRTIAASFVDGEGSVGGIATEFDYSSTTDVCFYSGDAIQHCEPFARGQVLALCTSSGAREIAAVGIRNANERVNLSDATLTELRTAATARPGNTGLRFQAVNCDGSLESSDTVTVLGDGQLIQNSGPNQGTITALQAVELFSGGITAGTGAGQTRIGSRGYKYIVGSTTTFFVVNYGAPTSSNSTVDLPPKLFVSVN